MNLLKRLHLCFVLILIFNTCEAKEIEIPIDEPVDDSIEAPVDDPTKETHHPFLIVKKDQYQDLRGKASLEPWKSMKVDAILRSKSGSSTEAYQLQEYVGAAALAYILDEENKNIHATRVKDAGKLLLRNGSKIDLILYWILY